MATRILHSTAPQSILRHSSSSIPRLRIIHHARTFFSNPLSSPSSSSSSSSDTQALTASRTLPYDALSLFNIITDISAYPKFLPFCRHANVTQYSNPDAHLHRKWPARATLSVGYADALTEFESSVYCVPPHPKSAGDIVGICEAVSGDTQSSLLAKDLEHYSSMLLDRKNANTTTNTNTKYRDTSNIENGPLAHLRTTWTVRPHPHKLPSTSYIGIPEDERGITVEGAKTDVHLSIEFRFRSTLLEMMSRAATPRVAEMMVEAFVGRVKEVLGR